MPLKIYFEDQMTNFLRFIPCSFLWDNHSELTHWQPRSVWMDFNLMGLEFIETPVFFLPAPHSSVSSEEGSMIKKTFTLNSCYVHLLFSSSESKYELSEKGCLWMQYFWYITTCNCSNGSTCAGHPAVLNYKLLPILRPFLNNVGNPTTITQFILEYASQMLLCS